MQNKDIINFIFELGQQKRIEHEGWRVAGIEVPDSVADHSLRAAQIAFILAKMENYENPCEICAIAVFHDIGECRIGDIHKIANRYVEADEEKAVKEQTQSLESTGKEIFNLWKQIEYKDTVAGKLAKDADLLEMAFMAKEYIAQGYSFAEDWIKNIEKTLHTESAKKLLTELKKSNPNDWWQGLKKL